MAFAHAHDFKIDTFNVLDRHEHTHTHLYSRSIPTLPSDPLQILRDARAVEATHTSKTAAYAPKCRPGSRAKAIQDILRWVTTDTRKDSSAGSPKKVLWFQGPAGGGKTCIMREVVARCEQLGLFTASYFFSTRVPGLDHETPFIATIACQLLKNSAMRAEMSQAILEHPDILKESLEFQAEKLFLSPLLTAEGHAEEPRRKIIVVDGLDECRDSTARIHLLHVLQRLATSPRDFLVVIASRPEVDIRMAFGSPLYQLCTMTLRLQDYDGTSEIRDYLCDEFCSIRETHPARESIPPNWPAESILDPLVTKSSGLYIYPSTVIKYVRNPRRNPVAMLLEVLSLQATNNNPLAELDALYHLILHPPDVHIPTLKRLLHCIIATSSESSPGHILSPHATTTVTPVMLDSLLDLPDGTTTTTLCDMHSLVSVPSSNQDGSLRFYHKSLEDYISDERAGDLHQVLEETHRDLAQACISYLRKWPEQIRSGSREARTEDASVLKYAIDNWTSHLTQLFMTRCRRHKAKAPMVDLLPKSITSFDPAVLWKIQLLWPSHSSPVVPSPMPSTQRDLLHVLICTLSIGARSPGTTPDDCIPICTRASQLIAITDIAESFIREHRCKTRPDEHMRATALEMDGLLSRFEEVLSRASPRPKRSLPPTHVPHLTIPRTPNGRNAAASLYPRSSFVIPRSPPTQTRAATSQGLYLTPQPLRDRFRASSGGPSIPHMSKHDERINTAGRSKMTSPSTEPRSPASRPQSTVANLASHRSPTGPQPFGKMASKKSVWK